MNEKRPYSTPELEQHGTWQISTGVSLPIGASTGGLGDFLEYENVLEEKQ